MSAPAAGAPAPGAVRELGSSGVRVSALSLGTAPLGGLYTAVDREAALATVGAALDAGVSYVDTAPHYGLGRAEELLGAALAGRARPAVSTKVGRRLRPLRPGEEPEPEGFAAPPPRRRVWDFSRAGVRAALEESLERLGLDRVDIVYLHDPDVRPEHEREVYETAYPALAQLRDQGVVGAIGAGMNQAAMLTRFVERLDLDAVLCAGRYTLLDGSALHGLFPACQRRGTSVVVGGVFNSGLLADPRPGARFDYAPAPPHLVERAAELQRTCAAYGVPLRAAALRYAAAHPAVASVLVGCRSAAEVRENAAAWSQPVPGALWDALALPGPRPSPAGASR
ncbi:aldo/keto reductase [Nocardiopsis coralliicola]